MVAISIITISYNQGRYLEQNFRSVRAQDFQDWEQVVVDPGSTDGSRELIAETARRDPRIRPVFVADHSPGEGLNNGLDRVNGDVFLCLNSDDELAPGGLSAVARRHREAPDFDTVIGHGWKIDGEGRPLEYVRSDRFSPGRYALSVAAVIQQSTSFKSRILADNVRFNPELPTAWDLEFLLDAAHGRRCRTVGDVIGYFRVHPSSIGSTGQPPAVRRRLNGRLRRKAAPYVPTAILVVAAFLARTVRFIFDRAWKLVRRPRFPGLAR
jgi:glycosyltransferase involved in cell wall biosynthesis